MPYTYASFQKALALEMVVPNANVSDPNFIAILPTIIDYSEGRCYRELDLLSAETEQAFPMIPYQRSQDFGSTNAVNAGPTTPQILIPERVVVFPPNLFPAPPQGVAPTVGGEPVYPVSPDYLDAVYTGVFPNPPPSGRPVVFAVRDNQNLIFGPIPDQAYYFSVWGSYRPIPLYSAAPADGTQTSFLTVVLPELFLAAAMVAASGYRKNYGAQADEARMAISWESQFQTLLASAKTEEIRKRFLGWNQMSSYSPPPVPAPAPAAA